MQLDEAIKKRRSIRKYKKEVPDMKLIEECIKAASLAPSAHDIQPWRFFIVTDRKKIGELSRTQKYSAFLKNAPMVIVATAEETNHFVEDCSSVIMLLMLKATELGLGTCWNVVYLPNTQEREDYVRKVLNIPKKYRIVANIGIGYPDEELGEKTIKKFEEIVEVVE